MGADIISFPITRVQGSRAAAAVNQALRNKGWAMRMHDKLWTHPHLFPTCYRIQDAFVIQREMDKSLLDRQEKK